VPFFGRLQAAQGNGGVFCTGSYRRYRRQWVKVASFPNPWYALWYNNLLTYVLKNAFSDSLRFWECLFPFFWFVTVPYPFHLCSISVQYPFCTRSLPILYPFCSRSRTSSVFYTRSQMRSLLGFFWSVLYSVLLFLRKPWHTTPCLFWMLWPNNNSLLQLRVCNCQNTRSSKKSRGSGQ